MLTLFFKGMVPFNITQGYHTDHKALDIMSWSRTNGYGTPLCAPENCRVDRITSKEQLVGHDQGLVRGHGVWLTGLETGYRYLFWHTLPLLPVNGGDIVKRGQIVAYMGNAGYVVSGGQYVPIEERTTPPYRGTHLHIEMFDKNGNAVDPKPFINWNWQPQYTLTDFMTAMIAVLQKAIRLY
jgi:hypothetical protein